MSLVITEPSKSVEGLTTRILAARSQVRYVVQRQDVLVNDLIIGGGGNLLLNIVGTDLTGFVVGEQVYMTFNSTAKAQGYVDGLYTILTAIVSGNVKVTIDTPYIAPDVVSAGNFVNQWENRANYYLSVDFFGFDGVSN
jgi:hypothetical protein